MSSAHGFFDNLVRVNRILLEHPPQKRISASDQNSNLVSSCGWDRSGGHFRFPQVALRFSFASRQACLSQETSRVCSGNHYLR
jgi:hypothetical protein